MYCALGLNDELHTVQFVPYLGRYILLKKKIDYTINLMKGAVEKLHALSPLWDMLKEKVLI